jgi:hypothetical protein
VIYQFFGRNYQSEVSESSHLTGMRRKTSSGRTRLVKNPRSDDRGEGMRRPIPENDHEAAVAEFIRKRGVTRCPTACVLPSQGSIAAADRAALAEYAMARDRARRAKVAAHTQFGAADVSSSAQKNVP